jgi:hypothetical protein
MRLATRQISTSGIMPKRLSVGPQSMVNPSVPHAPLSDRQSSTQRYGAATPALDLRERHLKRTAPGSHIQLSRCAPSSLVLSQSWLTPAPQSSFAFQVHQAPPHGAARRRHTGRRSTVASWAGYSTRGPGIERWGHAPPYRLTPQRLPHPRRQIEVGHALGHVEQLRSSAAADGSQSVARAGAETSGSS